MKSDLPDEEAATQEAIAAAREIIGDCIRHGSEFLPGTFVVINEHDRQVTTLPIEDVLSPYVAKVPACPKCRESMTLVNVDLAAASFDNLSLWSYVCDACGMSASNFVAK